METGVRNIQSGNPLSSDIQVEHCPFNCDSDFKIFKSRKEMLDLIQKGYLELQVLYQAIPIHTMHMQYIHIMHFRPSTMNSNRRL